MTLHKRLLKICDLLDAGLSPRAEIVKTLHYSEEQARKTPGQQNPESLTVATTENEFPAQSQISVGLSRSLAELASSFSTSTNKKDAALTFRNLVKLWKAETTKPSRKHPDKDVTKWVRKNWHNHGYKKAATVRAYISIKGLSEKLYDALYAQVGHDCRQNPMTKPKKQQ